MTKLFVGAALVASVFAAPAFAQSWDPSAGSGNIVEQYPVQATHSGRVGSTGAFAYIPTHPVGQQAMAQAPAPAKHVGTSRRHAAR
jgi:hypothetical protein